MPEGSEARHWQRRPRAPPAKDFGFRADPAGMKDAVKKLAHGSTRKEVWMRSTASQGGELAYPIAEGMASLATRDNSSSPPLA